MKFKPTMGHLATAAARLGVAAGAQAAIVTALSAAGISVIKQRC